MLRSVSTTVRPTGTGKTNLRYDPTARLTHRLVGTKVVYHVTENLTESQN